MERELMRLDRKVLLGALLAALCLACSNLNIQKPTSSKTNTTSTTADAPQRPVEKRASGARFFRVSDRGLGRELGGNEVVLPGDRLTLELTYPQAVPFDAKSGLALSFSLKSGVRKRSLTWLFKLAVPGGSASRRHQLVWVLGQRDVDTLLANFDSSGLIEMSIETAGLEKLIVEPIQELALTMPAQQSWPLRLAGRAADSGEEAGFPLLLEHGELSSAVELTVRRTDRPGNLSFKVAKGTVVQSHTLDPAVPPASLKLYIPSNLSSNPSASQLENFPDDAEFEVTLTEGAGREEVAKASFKPAQLLSLRASQPEAPLTAYRLGSAVIIQATVNKPLQPGSRLRLTLDNGDTVDLVLDASQTQLSATYRVQQRAGETGTRLQIASLSAMNWKAQDGVLLDRPAKTASFAIAVDSQPPLLSSIKVERTADSVELTAASPPLKMGETATLKLTFSEEVQITQSQLSYGGRGTVVWNTSPEQFIAEHSLTFTPSVSYQGNVFFSLPWEAYQDKAGNHGVGTGASTAFPVDTLLKISAVTITPARGTTIGENGWVEIAVTFNQAVNISGTPSLPFTIGGSNREACYDRSRSAGNAAVAVFTYQVQSGDSGTLVVNNGASISPSASILDRQGSAVFNLPELPGAQGGEVNAGLTGVVAVAVDPALGQARRSGNVHITVTFSAAVRVGGSPSIAFIMGSGEGSSRTATYDREATRALADPKQVRFSSPVGNEDNGALRIAAGTSITLRAGDSISNADSSNTTPQLALGGERYAGSVDTLAPTISGVEFNPAAASQVGKGGNVDITVTFSEPMRVVNSGADAPQIPFLIGIGAGDSKKAKYDSAATGALTDSKKVLFRYVVTDRVNGVLRIAANTSIELGASGSSISDLAGNTGALVLPETPGGTVDTTAPTISGVEFSPAAGSQVRQGGNVDITVTFSEPMRVVNSGADAPQIPFLIGSGAGASKKASYHSAATGALNDLKKLLFRYEVQDGDTGALSIAAAASIELGASGSSISDLAGNAVDAAARVLPATSGGNVDAVLPTVNRVSITPELGASVGSYDSVADTIAGEILISVTYSKAITVEGEPHIPFLINNTPRSAIYHQGSGSTTLVFRRYPLAWADKGYVSIAAATSIALGAGGSMKDADANPAPTSLGLEAAKVGGRVYLGPMVTAIDITPASADYVEREGVIVIAVTFDEAVAVTGTPTLPFRIGDATGPEASYDASRTATRNQVGVLVFSYTLPANASNGKILLLGKIDLPAGATIQSVAQSEQPAVRRFAKVSGGRVAIASDLAPADNAPEAQDGYVFDSSNGKDGVTRAKAIGVKWHPANGTNVDFAAGSMLHLDALVQRTFASTLRFQGGDSDSTLVDLTDADASAEGVQYTLELGALTLKITDPATNTRAEKSLYFTLLVVPPALSPTIVNSSLLQVSNLLTGASWRYSLNDGSSWIDVAAASTSVSLPPGVYSETALRRLQVQQQADGLLSAAAALPESALSQTFVVGPAPSTSYRALRIASSKGQAQNLNRVVLPPELAAQSVAFWAQAASLSSELSMLFSARAAVDVQLYYQNDALAFWRDIGNKEVKDQATPLSWHHYLVVKSGTTVTFYRDGQQLWAENALNVDASFADKAIQNIVFGNDDRNPSKHENWTRQFNGLIKGIQLWDKTFDAAEAQTFYNRGRELPSDISKLVAFYPLQGETMSDVVAGGQSLGAISFDASKLYAAGMVGVTVDDGRPPLRARLAAVNVIRGETSYQLSRDLLEGIPAGATIRWSTALPSSGATTGRVVLIGGATLTTTVADGAVQVSATSSATDDYLEGTATFKVYFSRHTSSLTRGPDASGNNAGYVFDVSNNKDGSSADRAIVVRGHNLSLTAGITVRLDTLVSGVVGALSYRSVGGPELNPLVDADTQLAGFQYDTPASVTEVIFKVSDAGTATREGKALYFRLPLGPAILTPVVRRDQVGVSGLVGSHWQYSFDSDNSNSWSDDIFAIITPRVALPNGVYNKTALSRLRVRQKKGGIYSSPVALSAEALAAAPTFVVGAPSTGQNAWRIASPSTDQNWNRLVLPPELTAQSVAFWAKIEADPTGDLGMIFSLREVMDIQMYYDMKGGNYINFWNDHSRSGQLRSVNRQEWYHFLFVKIGTSVIVYINGHNDKKANLGTHFSDKTFRKMVFGNDHRNPQAHSNFQRQFNGLIKGIQLWDKTFDAAGAQELYNKGGALPDDISQLKAFYPLQGTPVKDMVAGGPPLNRINFDGANPYAPGIVGGSLVTG